MYTGQNAYEERNMKLFLISNFCRVLNVVRFLLGNSAASEFYVLTFRNTVFFHLHRRIGILHTYPPMKMEQAVLRNVGI
jgi:hypothetical protein